MILQYLDLLDPDGAAFWRLRLEPVVWATLAAAALVLYGAHYAFQRLIFPLDWFDIIIHEAGHPIFGLLGNRWIMFAGGTLNQLLWPWIFYFHFLRERSPKSADFCIFWFGSNFLGIGPYMADARAQVLPLIGGGEHDWTYLFNSVGLINYDKQIGAMALYFGCFAMVFSAFTLVEHLRKEKRAVNPMGGSSMNCKSFFAFVPRILQRLRTSTSAAEVASNQRWTSSISCDTLLLREGIKCATY